MQRLFTMFPLGAAGIALLLLRISAAAALVWLVYSRTPVNPSHWVLAGVVVLAASLTLGIFTPIFCILCCCLETAAMFSLHRADIFCGLFVLTNTAALALLGPGGYSLDARMFGRRRVILSTEDTTL